MKLFGSFNSPYVRHCRVALLQGDIDFDFIQVDYHQSALESPVARVPYLSDGEQSLSDSSSILKYVREKSGKIFLAEIEDFDSFALATTVLDATINLFFIEIDGFGPSQIKYLDRQRIRVEQGLKELNERVDPTQGIQSDSALRCACLLDWALFRKRISIDGLDNLQGLLITANQHKPFSDTAPFE